MDIKAFLKGALKSKTNWLGVLLAIVAWYQMPQNHAVIATIIDPLLLARIELGLSLLVIVVRSFTNQSLTEKGSSSATDMGQGNSAQ